MKNKHLQFEEPLSLQRAAVVFFIIAAVVGIAIAGGVWANQQRQQRIISQYSFETDQLIGSKQDEFKTFFTDIFDSCAQELTAKQETNSVDTDLRFPPPQERFSCETARDQLAAMEVDQLKDSSSTLYLRVSGTQQERIDASGFYTSPQALNSISYGQQELDLQRILFRGERSSMWADYLYDIPGKEVVVPVEIDGETVGFIFRGVLER